MDYKLVIIIFCSIVFGVTGIDFSDRIVIDGLSDEYTLDEFILSDSLGNLLESPADSYWGEYNDIKQIKVTWDLNNLYIAIDACSWDNNFIIKCERKLQVRENQEVQMCFDVDQGHFFNFKTGKILC